ncbi:MAG: prepilin-type N-terminal cleavage/methylation domain-containing protein [Candidatus Omnitrophica bacterium]|nr:prepilin-type N-terminal cleavage/methylation domain-containing protein [Candidatus Omnitrophota bacterium]
MLTRKMFSRIQHSKSGYSLVEVLIGVALISVVFLSSKKMVAQMQDGSPELDLLLATEHFSRKAMLGNFGSVSVEGAAETDIFPEGAGNQVVIRRDYDLNDNPLMTPGDTSDDTFLKYGIIDGGLHFKIESLQAGTVDSSDPEVINGLQIISGYFQKDSGSENRIFFTITSPAGGDSSKTSQTEVMMHGGAFDES